MIIINQGDKPYIITLVTNEKFQVCANSKDEALCILANHFRDTKSHGIYHDEEMLKIMAEHSPWKRAENPLKAFANAHDLTPCGNSGIYLEIKEVEEPICTKN